MFNRSPSDRMQVRELGNLQPPGTCSVCGNGTDINGYFDPDIWIEYFGQVYLCMSNCAKQAIEVIGGLVPEEAEHLKELSTQIAAEHSELKDKYDAAIRRLDVYDTVVLDAADRAGLSDSIKQKSGSQPESNDDSANSADDGESESKESVTSPGPSDTPFPELRDESRLTL
jgi:hypothetical protein